MRPHSDSKATLSERLIVLLGMIELVRIGEVQPQELDFKTIQTELDACARAAVDLEFPETGISDGGAIRRLVLIEESQKADPKIVIFPGVRREPLRPATRDEDDALVAALGEINRQCVDDARSGALGPRDGGDAA